MKKKKEKEKETHSSICQYASVRWRVSGAELLAHHLVAALPFAPPNPAAEGSSDSSPCVGGMGEEGGNLAESRDRVRDAPVGDLGGFDGADGARTSVGAGGSYLRFLSKENGLFVSGG